MVDGVLNNARRLQTASEAYLHDAVVVDRIRPPMKPDKGRVAEIAQPKSLDSCDRVALGRGEHELVLRDQQMGEISIRLYQAEDKSCIELARSNGFSLLIRQHGMQLQLRVRLPETESPKRIWHYPVPRDTLHESHAERSGFTACHALSSKLGLIDVLKNLPRVVQKQLSRRAQLHTAG